MQSVDYLRVAVWCAALFFSSAWSLGLILDPRQRLKCTVVTVGLWWPLMAFPALGAFSVLHLLWLMPLALLVPGAIQGGHLKRTMMHPSLAYIFTGSLLPVLGPATVLSFI
jgi:hypothetical protein